MGWLGGLERSAIRNKVTLAGKRVRRSRSESESLEEADFLYESERREM